MASFTLQIHKATDLENSYRRAGTSGHDLPNPYVVVSLDGQTLFRTDTVKHNVNPVWNASFNVDLNQGDSLVLDVLDNIRYLPDVSLGQLVIPVEKLKAACASGHPMKLDEKIYRDSMLYVAVRLKEEATTLRSRPSGRRRAVLVGINYLELPKGKGQLQGCWNDTKNVKKLIVKRFGFEDNEIRVMTDEPSTPANLVPNRANLLASFEWLLDGAMPGDHFVFHFSGHGGQVPDVSGDEDDGKDETIFPVDFRKTGSIIDDKLNELLVQRLPDGCRLFSLMDCCHSGTGMDLPYEYKENGSDRNLILSRGDGNKVAAVNLGFVATKTRADYSSGQIGDVVLLSGCKDDQTSADATMDGSTSGAMTFAMVKVFDKLGDKPITFGQLLREMREILIQKKLPQLPQLSSSRSFDFNTTTVLI